MAVEPDPAGAGRPRQTRSHPRAEAPVAETGGYPRTGMIAELAVGNAPLSGRRGVGVRVAVVDSGVHAPHPHVGGVAGGVVIGPEGAEAGDPIDRLGHGTAVAAVIREKAPAAELLSVKVFGDRLSTSCAALVRAIEWTAEHGSRLVNLSLGTANPAHEAKLAGAVARAGARGALVVSAREGGDARESHRRRAAESRIGARWLPGSLPGVIGVLLDWSCPRHSVRLAADRDGTPVFLASGFPRPIPGVSPARNLGGVSFAVANVTGVLARLLEREPGALSAADVLALARRHAVRRPVIR